MKWRIGSGWPSGRASDSESRGPGFDLHNGNCVVYLSMTHELSRVLVNTQDVLAPSRHD